MAASTELVIGFDAREMLQDFKETWEPNRIQEFLLMSSIRKPLSTDVQIWDSIFHVLRIEIPKWTGPRQSLWDNLDNLRQHLSAEHIIDPYWVIAITEFVSLEETTAPRAHYEITPAELSATWSLLGYDISDHYLLSGLTNASYSPNEQESLKHRWGGMLNNYHLFSDLDSAFDFKEVTNRRVMEHSPFSVYGIYLIQRAP